MQHRSDAETEAARGLVLDGKQAMRLLGAARDPQERALLALAITTGMRHGEIFALSWNDLDLNAGTVSVKER